MKFVAAFISALLFGLGLGISGMTNPNNVIGFLDIFGDWKPALLLVMVGAISFHAATYFIITKRQSPLFSESFQIPTNRSLDKRLIFGSALFGLGWGVAGYCPGPAITSLATSSTAALLFCAAMLCGISLYHYIFKPMLSDSN